MRLRLAIPLTAALLTAVTLTPPPARAGDECYDLWQRRNAIFARAGHCFKTKDAIALYGRGCRPPYGRLTGSQQRRVNRIVAQERRLGC